MDDVENEIRQLEEEIKSVKAARQAIKENRELQMPIITNRRTNVTPIWLNNQDNQERKLKQMLASPQTTTRVTNIHENKSATKYAFNWP